MRQIITLMMLGMLLLSCANSGSEEKLRKELNHLEQERDSLQSILSQNKAKTNAQIASFLTFQEANAEEAMKFYVELFDNSKIIEIQRYQLDEPGKEGTIKMARFSLNGSHFICSDSYIKHEWSFTPAISVYVEIKTEGEINKLFDKLWEGGNVFMPLGNYGFSKQFGFVEDRFGISWQLNLVE